MKGLILKDILCLKKNLKLFVLVTLGVILLSVMFVLSSRFGNIADAMNNYNEEDTMSKEMLLKMMELAMHLILFIPMAFIGNVIDCFKEDRKADFYRNLLGMPVNNMEIAGARYISMMIYVTLGFICSVIAALGISAASDRLVFKDMLSAVLVFGGVLMIYMSIVMPCLYGFGVRKADIISGVPFVFILIGGAFLMDRITSGSSTGMSDEMVIIKLINDFKDFLTHKGGVVIAVASICLTVAYLFSVKILEKKRGLGL